MNPVNLILNLNKNMAQFTPEEEIKVPDVDFMFREDGEFVIRSSKALFGGIKSVIFALPGAFTPTCSAYQLPGYEAFYDMFKEQGIDRVYCISVNDCFVMNAWAKDQNIEKVQLVPDGNAEFTSGMGMLVKKFNLGFAMRSWRYAAVINDEVVEQLFVEDGMEDNCPNDPYEWSSPEKVLEYLKETSSVTA